MSEQRKIDVFTNIYANRRVFSASMWEFYYKSLPHRSVLRRHCAVDCHYPIDREENAKGIREVCEHHGIWLKDSGSDRGLCENFNFLWDQTHPHPDDGYFLGLDPDSNPGLPEWYYAMTSVLDASPDLGFICLALSCTKPNIKSGYLKGKVEVRGGHSVFIADSVDAMNVTMWKNSFWNRMGALTAPRQYYGFVEGTICRSLNEQRLRYGYLLDIECGPCFAGHADPEYTLYKVLHAGGVVLCSMMEWLASASFIDTVRRHVRAWSDANSNHNYVMVGLRIIDKHRSEESRRLLDHVAQSTGNEQIRITAIQMRSSYDK